MKAPLCNPCREESGRWLDTKPSHMYPQLGIAHGSGANYDVSAAGLRDRGRARHEQWRQTVRFQMDLIATTCRAQGHSTPAADPAPTVVQLDLLGVLDGLERAS